jgi:hypothetical protein
MEILPVIHEDTQHREIANNAGASIPEFHGTTELVSIFTDKNLAVNMVHAIGGALAIRMLGPVSFNLHRTDICYKTIGEGVTVITDGEQKSAIIDVPINIDRMETPEGEHWQNASLWLAAFAAAEILDPESRSRVDRSYNRKCMFYDFLTVVGFAAGAMGYVFPVAFEADIAWLAVETVKDEALIDTSNIDGLAQDVIGKKTNRFIAEELGLEFPVLELNY